jgi:hypothetical protein
MEDTYLIVAGELLDLPNFKLPEIQLTERDMNRVVVADNLRLGNRLERFFSFIIKESKQYEVVAENIQVFENKRITIGELDFILYDKAEDKYIHVELAGKIYLYDPTIENELSRWIGPNRRDSLVKKTKKLREKQFPLLYNKNTRETITPIDIAPIQQQVCLKARLFTPYNLSNTKLPNVSRSNIKGYYTNLEHFITWKTKAFLYFIPNKQDWIVDPKYGEIWRCFDEVLPIIKQALDNNMSPLIWMKKSEIDFESIFVVWW